MSASLISLDDVDIFKSIFRPVEHVKYPLFPHRLRRHPSTLALSNEPKIPPADCHRRRCVSINDHAKSILRPKADRFLPGAGVGGVAAAARLAKAGFKVTVFEKNDFTGGRCSLIHHEGYVSDFEHLSSFC